MAKVVFQSGSQAGHEFQLGKSTIFGRQSTSDVVLQEKMSSRQHFVIERFNGLYCVRDSQSRNGTRVNGNKVKQALLEFGDVIRVGETELKLIKEAEDQDIQSLLGDKYDIERKIGEGGMGVVFGPATVDGPSCCLEDSVTAFGDHADVHATLLAEARAAGRLNHPNIVQVHDVDTSNGLYFFAMEYIDGATCQAVIERNGPMQEAEALEITKQVAKALQYAHDQGLVHRDVKPDNIMIGTDTNAVKLADLGISKNLDEDGVAEQTMIHERRAVGTPQFMSPEAAREQRVSSASDLYSLGATLYTLLTKQPLFNADNGPEILRMQINDKAPDVRGIANATSAGTANLINALLAKDPAQRPDSGTDIVNRIGDIQATIGGGNEPPPLGETLMLKDFAAGKNPAAASAPPPRRTATENDAPNTPPRRRTGAGGDVKRTH